jgi:hypothetical protein
MCVLCVCYVCAMEVVSETDVNGTDVGGPRVVVVQRAVATLSAINKMVSRLCCRCAEMAGGLRNHEWWRPLKKGPDLPE